MARRFINTAKYNPYTFEEMWRPAMEATQMHMQQAQNLAQLNAQAASLGSYIDPQVDPEAYEMWNNYLKNAKSVSDDLYTNGISTKAFNRFMDLTTQYAQSIQPLETGIKNKMEFTKAYRDMQAKNPDMVMLSNPDDYKLSYYMHGIPSLEGVSGNTIQKQVHDLAKDIYGGNETVSRESYNKFYDIIHKQTGITPDQFYEEMNNPESGLQMIMNYVLQNNKADQLNPEDQQRMYQYALMGATTGAIGGTKDQMVDSPYFKEQGLRLRQAAFNHRINQDRINNRFKAAGLAMKVNKSNGNGNQMSTAITGGASIVDNNMYATHLNTANKDAYTMYDAVSAFINKNGGAQKIEVTRKGDLKIGKTEKLPTKSNKATDKNYISGFDMILDPNFTDEGFVLVVGTGKEDKPEYYLVDPITLGYSGTMFNNNIKLAKQAAANNNTNFYVNTLNDTYAKAMENIQRGSGKAAKIFSGKDASISDLENLIGSGDYDDDIFDTLLDDID